MASPCITSLALLFLISATCLASMVQSTQTRPMNNTVSAIYVFGDSTVDPGNNNYIKTLFKANWHPYGKDFINHTATGRFTNGKLTTDFIGYDVANIGCCGTGAVESSFLCNRASPVCTNASKYVFFDSMHPTEKAYHDLFKSFIPVINYVIKN